MKIGAIIQARTGSTRLPEKVLMKLIDKTVLEHVVERVNQAELIDTVIVATTVSESDNKIAELAENQNWPYYRGSEEDVLSRYFESAEKFDLDIIVRVTSDCPLIDPFIIDSVIRAFIEQKCDIASNGGPEEFKTFPRGLDVEVFSFEGLREAYLKATEKYQREHVTPYLYESEKVYRYSNSIDLSHIRITLDTHEDFKLINSIYEGLYKGKHDFYFKEIISFLEAYPELLELNKDIVQKKLTE